MNRPLTAILLAVACSSAGPGNDGGFVPDRGSGGGTGGTGGGDAGGCGNPIAGCPCANGGGSVALRDRLVVASRNQNDGGSVIIWNGVSSLTADTVGTPLPFLAAAPVAIAGVGGYATVVAIPAEPSAAQAWSGNLTSSVTNGHLSCDPPDPLPAVGSGAGMAELVGGLWFVRSPGTIARAVLRSAAPPSVFTRPGSTLTHFAFDVASDRVFAAQAGSPGIAVWRDAGMRVGDAGAPDFELVADAVTSLGVGDGRLYAASAGPQIRVWRDVSTLVAPRSSDFALSLDGGTVVHQQVFGPHLVATVKLGSAQPPFEPPARVLIYKDVASITGDRAPDVVIDHASLAGAVKAALGMSVGLQPQWSLLVLTPAGVAVFDDALGAPTLKTVLRSGIGAPTDMLYLP